MEIDLTEDQWVEQFKPTQNPRHSGDDWSTDYQFDWTQPDDAAYLKTASPYQVWTLIDGEDALCVSNGFRFVNRGGYFVTSSPWKEGETYYITFDC